MKGEWKYIFLMFNFILLKKNLANKENHTLKWVVWLIVAVNFGMWKYVLWNH